MLKMKPVVTDWNDINWLASYEHKQSVPHNHDFLSVVSGQPGEPLPISSEEEIFDYIDYEYKKPQERNV